MTDDSPTPTDDGEPTADDSIQETHPSGSGMWPASRRGILAALGGLGLLGGASILTGSGGARAADVVRSDGPWRVEVDDETGLRLEPPQRVTIEDDTFTGSGNLVVGHLNAIDDGVAGATVTGGGVDDHDDADTGGNTVHSHFGTISGGTNNVAGREGSPDEGTSATIGGGSRNESTAHGSTIAGGISNEATGIRSAVGGGINNEATGTSTTVGGGIGNHADGKFATVAGGGGNSATAKYAGTAAGRGNHATGEAATIAGGHKNSARATWATVGGGYYNKAHGYGATVPGGSDNVADGAYAFATGYHAETNGHDGAFVVADSSDEPHEATGDDAAFFQMPIHAPAFNTTSTRTAKTDVEPVDTGEVLDGVRDLDVNSWVFEDGDDRHLGPMAEDFEATFELGGDAESIASVDADGVALAAIQELADELEAATERVAELEDELAAKDDRIDELESRLAAIEDELGAEGTVDEENGERAQASP
jgi:hypothetical protein